MIILHRKARAAQELFPLFSLGVIFSILYTVNLAAMAFEKDLHVTQEVVLVNALV